MRSALLRVAVVMVYVIAAVFFWMMVQEAAQAHNGKRHPHHVPADITCYYHPEVPTAAQNGKKCDYIVRVIRRLDWSPYSPHDAMEVAECESHLQQHASNGQYKNLFQMGYSERQAYGHGWKIWRAVRAAHRYFVASGRDWSPWSCKPY